MEPEQFSKFRHKAVHELMDLNEFCAKEYSISSWPKWEYDLDRGILAFTKDGVPQVLASIQVVGTTSTSSRTWLWGWANQSLTPKVTTQLAKVRAFGEAEKIAELTNAELPDDEHLGWGLTAVAAKLLGAKGAYRCPGDNGFAYIVYSSIGFAGDASPLMNKDNPNACDDENGNCRACGHPFAPHVVIAYDRDDLTKGGEIHCQIEGCDCLRPLNFDLSDADRTKKLNSLLKRSS